jgi:hypothetical protein
MQPDHFFTVQIRPVPMSRQLHRHSLGQDHRVLRQFDVVLGDVVLFTCVMLVPLIGNFTGISASFTNTA